MELEKATLALKRKESAGAIAVIDIQAMRDDLFLHRCQVLLATGWFTFETRLGDGKAMRGTRGRLGGDLSLPLYGP